MGISNSFVTELDAFSRSASGAFLKLSDGRIMYAYNHFLGTGWNDDHPANIGCVLSNDGGYTWTEEGTDLVGLADHAGAVNVMTPSLLRMANGDIGLFYLVRKGFHDCRLYLRRSNDEGRSWGAAVCCIPAPGYYVVNNERVVRLSSGRILVPANYHRMRGEDRDDWASLDYRGLSLFLISDDDGHTWRESTDWLSIPTSRSKSGLQESGIIEKQSGVVWAWSRTDLGRQYETFSFDGGETWTTPEPSVFASPCSPLSMKRFPRDGSLLAAWNPTPKHAIGWHGGRYAHGTGTYVKEDRTPLVLAVSFDDGSTWSEPVVLEDDPAKGFDYPSILFDDNRVVVAYRVIYRDQKRTTRIRVLDWTDIMPNDHE